MTTAGGRVAGACIPVAQRQGATCPVTPGESRASTPSPSRAGASQPTESQARLAKKATVALASGRRPTGVRVTAAACQSAGTAKGHCKFKFPANFPPHLRLRAGLAEVHSDTTLASAGTESPVTRTPPLSASLPLTATRNNAGRPE